MRVLFVRSLNRGAEPISQNQGDSLQKVDCEVVYFDIVGKGLFGYLKNIFRLRKVVRVIDPEIIHSHYSISGIIAFLSRIDKPVIASLMGSDVNNTNKFMTFWIKLFIRFCWEETIVKTLEMKQKLSLNKILIIPNGVDFNLFKQIDRSEAIDKLGWNAEEIHILFGSDPTRPEKNFKLANEAIHKLKEEFTNVSVHCLLNIPRQDIFLYYNAANVLLFTSFKEGSPNVIKEAMACCCPIVTTIVGDVKEVIGNTTGCYYTKFDSADVVEKLKMAVLFRGRTNGRRNVEAYNSDIISEMIIKIYKSVADRKN